MENTPATEIQTDLAYQPVAEALPSRAAAIPYPSLALRSRSALRTFAERSTTWNVDVLPGFLGQFGVNSYGLGSSLAGRIFAAVQPTLSSLAPLFARSPPSMADKMHLVDGEKVRQ